MPSFRLVFSERVPDTVWGQIPVTALEQQLLRSAPLVRLGQIKQMGLAFLDYAALTHTRLEHSLGVMYVADWIYTTLRDTEWAANRFQPPMSARMFGDRQRQAIRLAALLHDVGHPPFSHAVELTFKRYSGLLEKAKSGVSEPALARLFEDYSHEAFTESIIEGLFREQSALREQVDAAITPGLRKQIPALAIGKATGSLEPFNPLISGDFDADRIDYLIRDNQHSGFTLGLSIDELNQAMHLRKNGQRYELYIDATALPFVNSVLAARDRLIRRVHLAPAGRIATQMMICSLYHQVCGLKPEKLAQRIRELHQNWTDFSFVADFLGDPADFAAGAAGAYFVHRFKTVVKRPSGDRLWKLAAHIPFMRMDPCLRMQAHIVATAGWQAPSDLMFVDGRKLLYIEPSTRPSQPSALLVDYERGEHTTTKVGTTVPPEETLDYIAATENRVGRAILAQAMTVLDIFAYELDPAQLHEGHAHDAVPEGSIALDDRAGVGHPSVPAPRARCRKVSDMLRAEKANRRFVAKQPRDLPEVAIVDVGRSHLDSSERKIAGITAQLAWEIRNERSNKGKNMIPGEYLLALLYCLEKVTRERWSEARGIHVYRAAHFIHDYVRQLPRQHGFPVREFFAREINAKRVFAEIQRLAVFGLIETRTVSVFNERRRIAEDPGKEASAPARSKPTGVHGTREEIRIGLWGKAYVESEMRFDLAALQNVVAERQERIAAALEKQARRYFAMHDIGNPVQRRRALAELEAAWYELQREAAKMKACCMLFSLPPVTS